MMDDRINTPLDYEEKHEDLSEDKESLIQTMFFLEFIPIVLIAIGIWLKKYGNPNWIYAFVIAGFGACILYMYFSWSMYRLKEYKPVEIGMAVLCAIFFPLGILSVIAQELAWTNSDTILSTAVSGGVGFCGIAIVLLLFNIQDDRASSFYRTLLARILILTAILLSVYTGI